MPPPELIAQQLEAFKQNPADPSLACNLADLLLENGRCTQAKALYEHALQYNPTLLRAWYGAGCADTDKAEFATAKHFFARAVELAPEWLQARHNLARALYELGHVDQAFTEFQHCAHLDREGSEHSRSMLAVIAPGVPHLDQAGILAVRANWANPTFETPARPPQPKPRQLKPPLRIGYLSSFFQRDNWMKPVWGLINAHDRQKVNITVFSDCPLNQIQHGYHPHATDRYFDISNTPNPQLRDLINNSEIDILIDLNGYSDMRRLPLFAQSLNPVTIGWFNMYATTGLPGFDYLIGDHQVLQPDDGRFYSEQLLRVPGTYLPFQVTYPVPPIATRPTGPRPLAFGSLASQYKITDQVIEAWAQILTAASGTTLLLKNKHLASPSTQDDLRTRFAQFSIPAHRLILEGPEDHFDFLKAYDRIDVALDTFPYNGGTTTSEAIWQGVPVLTFRGDRWASRTSASILQAAGLQRFIAENQAHFIQRAIELASSPDTVHELAALRGTMRESLQSSQVCDLDSFARAMEDLYFSAVTGVRHSRH